MPVCMRGQPCMRDHGQQMKTSLRLNLERIILLDYLTQLIS